MFFLDFTGILYTLRALTHASHSSRSSADQVQFAGSCIPSSSASFSTSSNVHISGDPHSSAATSSSHCTSTSGIHTPLHVCPLNGRLHVRHRFGGRPSFLVVGVLFILIHRLRAWATDRFGILVMSLDQGTFSFRSRYGVAKILRLSSSEAAQSSASFPFLDLTLSEAN